MAILNNSNAISSGGYDINNSLRFRSSASAYLSRTPSSATNRKTWTLSGWVKRGTLSSIQCMFGGGTTAANSVYLYWSSGDNLQFGSNGGQINLQSTAVYRDPSAWYHIVATFDTTQATAANRMRLYVNGVQLTAFNAATYPSQNVDYEVNSSVEHNFGRTPLGQYYFDGYMTDINFIDGQALEPYYFGNNDANGVWKPILYKGTYGTNGFYLTFADTSALTTSSNAGLGKDTSGNGNYWTTNNISITSGSTYDAMTDVPTNTSATVANYAVLNPLKMPAPASVSYTNGNLSVSCGNGNQTPALATIYPSSGKWYWEVIWTSGSFARVGVQNTNVASTDFAADTAGWRWESNTGNIYNGSTLATVSTYATNDVLGFCLDCDAGKLYVSKNGTWQNSAVPASGTGAVATNIPTSTLMSPAVATGSGTSVFTFNAGQRPFAYTPPTGFVALNTFNLPTPTILQGNKYMDATLYTSTGTSQVVVNQGQFKPDFVWTKVRGTTSNHTQVDSVRGADKYLVSNSTAAEGTAANYVTSFNSNGFSLGSDNYANGNTLVAWQWQAGQGSTSSGTGTGGITSVTQSVNTTAGFSIVTYTGSGANGTVTHGLGVAPKMIIVKWRSGGGLTAQDWNVYHTSVGATARLFLNTTAASATTSVAWNNTAPTSSVFSIGTGTDVNGNGAAYVAYCFAEIAGFSAFGSYTGNGSTDGPFVYTGFRPKFVMWKKSNAAESWVIIDTSRDPVNLAFNKLYANGTSGDDTGTTYGVIDALSNGFKIRSSHTVQNNNGDTYIYMAFAENPFKNSNAR